MEFGSLGSLTGVRARLTWPVDKSVDNVDNWEFGEFGSLTKRTYRYDYHASPIGWDITR